MARSRSTTVHGSPTVLITGAGRGLGKTAALKLASTGWHVYACVRTDADAQQMAAHAGITPVILDITNSEHLAKLTTQLPDRLDALVNNAGVAVGGPIETLAIDDLRWQLEVNVIGGTAVTQTVLPPIRKAKGRIVFISSTSGRVATPSLGAYGASKFALEAIGDSLRNELRPWGIRVSLIEPGQIDTDMSKDSHQQHDENVAKMTPEHQVLYAKHTAGMHKAIDLMDGVISSPEEITVAIERALTDKRPRARYLVGKGSKAHAYTRILPSAITDAIFSKATGIPKHL
ncbi:SDR family oxidoreductase [Mycobacterium sp. OTB74]|jgi:NAD(P)-dependent dehydrogenase (short-subunit alcohol dehydrogenase family)|uniref:SDR family oxidoreductase n=1 Tax=Mycobacterium sp. OTB74 TaxID=1853452 RepID=UPI0024739AD2|nr:SDR family oxidoreductase [Mycobacterium sp. OTB74]MDH6243997.1 NAD(P)-dependent dehydrogenase (short-subunit alcohol dehydrogenase family) [Mycobacterium sp. OTB74]